MKLRKAIQEVAVITVGTVIAAAVFFFMLPSHVSVGSGAALAMVLSNFIPLSVSVITLIMNILQYTFISLECCSILRYTVIVTEHPFFNASQKGKSLHEYFN